MRMKNSYLKIKKAFILFFYLDHGYFLRNVRLLGLQLCFYGYRAVRGGSAAFAVFRDRHVVLSVCRIKFGVSVVPHDLGYIYECVVEGVYASVAAFVPRPGDVCVDIGANIGSCALRWHRSNSSGRIICLEPHPGIRRRLVKNIELNGCSNIEVFPWALSDHDAPVKMSADDFSMMVQAHTLNYLVEVLSLPMIDLCKIDVEGHEVEVLRGAERSLCLIKRLVLEYHSESLKQGVKDILSRHFTIVKEEGAGCGLLFAENKKYR